MRWLEGLLTFGYRFRILTLLIISALCYVSWIGIQDLTVDTDLENLISSKVDRELYDELNAEFGADNVSVVFVSDGHLFSQEKLTKLDTLVKSLKAIKDIDKVDSIFSSSSIQAQGPQLLSKPIIEALPKNDDEAKAIKDKALEHPLLKGTLVSSDGKTTAINIFINPDAGTTDDNLQLYNDIQDVLRDNQYEFDTLFQMGDPRLTHDQYTSMFKDLATIGPIALAFLVGVLFIFFMSTSSFILPIVTAAVSIMWTFGFMGFVGIPLNLLIVMLPTLVMVMGATEDIHMLSSYLEEFEAEGTSNVTRKLATKFMIKKVSLPIVLTAVTTWFGFAVSQFSDIEMIKQFSQAASFSFIANAFATALLVPCYLSTFGPKPRERSALFNPYEGITISVVYLVERFPVLIVMFCSMIVGVMLVFADKVYVNTAPLSFFNDDHPLIVDANLLHDNLSGINQFFVTLEVPDEDGFKDPKNLAVLEQSVKKLRDYETVDSVFSLADYLSYINQQTHQGNKEYYSVPTDQAMVKQYLGAFKEGDLKTYVNPNYTRANIIVRHNIKNSRDLNNLLDDIRGMMDDEVINGMNYYVTGEDILINDSVADLLRSQVVSILYLIGAIFVIISLLFTSKLAGLIALVPNIVPMIILFGMMGYFEIPLNPGTTLVAVILISIAVDDTIHLFHAYIHECRHEMDNQKAIIKALKTQIRPIVTTSLALAIGFGTLMFSGIKLNSSFGMLAGTSILLAMICDLLLTPVILGSVRIVSLYNILSLHLFENVVQKSQLFEDMTPYEIKKAILLCATTDFRAGAQIIKQGEEEKEMYLVLKGQVDIERADENGITHHIATLSPGEVFGEVAFVGNVKRTASVVAKSDVSLIKFNHYQLTKNMRAHPKLAYKMSLNIAKILSQKLKATTEKIRA